MKLSAHIDSPYYDAEKVYNAKVFQNGKEVFDCFFIDTDEDYALVYDKDSNDRYILKGNQTQHKRIEGGLELRGI